jgi:hypothetical protein
MPALSLFSKASSLFARKEFPVMSHREFIGNSDIASYSFIGFISEGPKATKFPVLFLLAGNLDLADGFGRTTSTASNLRIEQNPRK